MTKSRIAWTERVWNPVTGCTKVSAGCKNCYAEAIAHRYWGERKFTDVRTHPERLDAPLRWRKPSRVFVNSMSDLFHEDVPFEFIDNVVAIMAMAQQHTFQVLTKRPERMREYFTSLGDGKRKVCDSARNIYMEFSGAETAMGAFFAANGLHNELSNVWLGVSVEDRMSFQLRVYDLLATPAAIHWLSVEPILGPVDFGLELKTLKCADEIYRGIDWVVVGGESGANHRPMEISWLESVVSQCRTAGVPVFVKQDSGRFPGKQGRIPDELWIKEYPGER